MHVPFRATQLPNRITVDDIVPCQVGGARHAAKRVSIEIDAETDVDLDAGAFLLCGNGRACPRFSEEGRNLAALAEFQVGDDFQDPVNKKAIR